MKHYIIYPSDIGDLRITCDEAGIIELILPCQQTRHSDAVLERNNPFLKKAAAWLDAYFSGQSQDLSVLPLQTTGTAFQQEVWAMLCRIPYGTTVTYGQLANEIAQQRSIKRMSAQAVGQAVGANPISIIIPCHRVIGAGGSLTGYDGGIENKKWLLCHEENKKLW